MTAHESGLPLKRMVVAVSGATYRAMLEAHESRPSDVDEARILAGAHIKKRGRGFSAAIPVDNPGQVRQLADLLPSGHRDFRKLDDAADEWARERGEL